jgi:predicted dehydrogenase
MNGVTGRMGYRQHLVRSVLAIRDDGGVGLAGGERIMVEPILVGRNAEKLAALAVQHGVSDFTTDLDEALEDDSASVYFDAQVTSERKKSILKAIGPASTSIPRSRSPSRSTRALSSSPPPPRRASSMV